MILGGPRWSWGGMPMKRMEVFNGGKPHGKIRGAWVPNGGLELGTSSVDGGFSNVTFDDWRVMLI